MQLEAAAAQRAALEKRLDSARAASQPSEAEVARLAELAKEIKALGKRVGEGEKKVGAADATLASLQEQVLAVGGIKLRAQKSKVETLGEQVSGLQQALTKANKKTTLHWARGPRLFSFLLSRRSPRRRWVSRARPPRRPSSRRRSASSRPRRRASIGRCRRCGGEMWREMKI